MQEAVPAGEGAMAAILGLDPQRVKEACDEAREQEPGKVVEPANYNSPEQTVIAGHASAVDRAIAACKAKGAKRALPLPVSAPFHCSLMSPVQPRLTEVLARVQFRRPNAPVIANATAEPNTDPARIVPLLLTQVTSPVRWVETVQNMALNGVDTLIELGPGKVLSGLARRIDKGLRTYSVEDPDGLAAVVREVFQ
jgi:[acyl-carrier-protein] S-malonyltransferase